MAQPGTDDGADPVQRMPALEDEKGPRGHGQGHHRAPVPGQDPGHRAVALVVGRPDPGGHLEVPAPLGRLDGQGDDEVGLVEVPLELVTLGHHGQVEGPERVGVAVERSPVEDGGDEAEEAVGFVEPPQR
jgi:hypothetical protein